MGKTNWLLTVPEGERHSWAYWLGCTEAVFDQSGLHLIPKQVQGNRLIVLVTKIGATMKSLRQPIMCCCIPVWRVSAY